MNEKLKYSLILLELAILTTVVYYIHCSEYYRIKILNTLIIVLAMIDTSVAIVLIGEIINLWI